MAYVFDQRLSYLGHQYEYWIGKSLEDDGYKVLYTGILYGTDDKGVDLVAIKNRDVYLIQCKWRKSNSIWIDDIKKASNRLCESKVSFENLPFKIHLRVYTTFASNEYTSLAPNVEFVVRPISEDELRNHRFPMQPQTSKSFERYVRDECAAINKLSVRRQAKTALIVLSVIVFTIWAIRFFSPDKSVYVAPYSGTKYHSSSGCEGLENAISIKKMSITDAKDQGYKPCGYCH